jgi:hypothetical protein
MQETRSRAFAVVGVVVAAIAAACLVWPAAQQLGSPDGLLIAAAIIGLPVLVALAASGVPYYGLLRSSVIAVGVALITCAVAWAVAAFGVASALSGSVSGLVFALVLFGGPALSVLIPGLLALRVVPAGSEDVAAHRTPQRQ